MQKTHYSLITLIVSVSVFNFHVQCMDPINETIQPQEPFPSHTLSLKTLCINSLAKALPENNIDVLTSPAMMEKFSSLSTQLNKKIMEPNSYLTFEFSHKRSSFCFNDYYLDETNNQVMAGSGLDPILKTFNIHGQEVHSFPWSYGQCEYNGALLCQADYCNEGKILIIKNGSILTEYQTTLQRSPFIRNLLRNQKEFIFFDKNQKYNLFNFVNSTMTYENADSIQLNKSENMCLIRNGEKVILHNRINGDTLEFDNTIEATLSPHGNLILIRAKNPHDQNICDQVISIKDGKVLFSFDTIKCDWKNVQFSPNERYLLIPSQDYKKTYIFDIETKNISCCLERSPYMDIYFYKKYLVVFALYRVYDYLRTVLLIHINDINCMGKGSVHGSNQEYPTYTVDDMNKMSIAKKFENVSHRKQDILHPSGNFIMTNDDHNWQLIHIESGKTIATIDNACDVQFSEPSGKIGLFKDYLSNHRIFSLHNDVTIQEYLVTRFMKEKNLKEKDLSHYPHLKTIYDVMIADKKILK